MFNFLKIAHNAFRESLREPVYALMLLVALTLIGHYPTAAVFVFSEQLKLVVDSAMATSLLFGLIAAVLSASHTVAREMRNGTVLLLLSKPVSRCGFIVGKILGILLSSTLFVAICNLGGIISVFIATDQFRFDIKLYLIYLGLVVVAAVGGLVMNFFRGSSFPEVVTWFLLFLTGGMAVTCIICCPEPTISVGNMAKAMLLVNFAVMAMTTLAVVAATRLDVVPNLCCCVAVFFLGLLSSYLFQRETGIPAIDFVFAMLYAVIPNWQYFWLVDAVAVGRNIPWGYIINAIVYVALYMALASAWAVVIFKNREPAEDNVGR